MIDELGTSVVTEVVWLECHSSEDTVAAERHQGEREEEVHKLVGFRSQVPSAIT